MLAYNTESTVFSEYPIEPAIGMSEYEVTRSSWGHPASKNRTVTKYATREQWVYGSGRYIYLENGRVTAISSRQ